MKPANSNEMTIRCGLSRGFFKNTSYPFAKTIISDNLLTIRCWPWNISLRPEDVIDFEEERCGVRVYYKNAEGQRKILVIFASAGKLMNALRDHGFIDKKYDGTRMNEFSACMVVAKMGCAFAITCAIVLFMSVVYMLFQ